MYGHALHVERCSEFNMSVDKKTYAFSYFLIRKGFTVMGFTGGSHYIFEWKEDLAKTSFVCAGQNHPVDKIFEELATRVA